MKTSDAELYDLLMTAFGKARDLVQEQVFQEDPEMPAAECHVIIHDNFPMLNYRPWINILLSSSLFQGEMREDSVGLLVEAIDGMHAKDRDKRYTNATFTLNMMLCAFDQKGPL